MKTRNCKLIRIISFILVLFLLTELMPIKIQADDGDPTNMTGVRATITTHKNGTATTTTHYSSQSYESIWSFMFSNNAMKAADSVVIKLYEDWDLGERLRIGNQVFNIVIDLNGHKIDRMLTSQTADGEVLYVNNTNAEYDVKIIDTSAGGLGKITGGFNATGGGGITIEHGLVELESGYISGNTSALGGGGIRLVGSGCTFVLSGGTVSDNRSVLSANYLEPGLGGGIYADNASTVRINSGDVSYNYAHELGGGIYITGADSYLELSHAGNVNNNITDVSSRASVSGGGIYIDTASAKIQGTVSQNTAGYGGGIYIFNTEDGKISIDGARITQNRASSGGGGIFFSGGNCFDFISGTVTENEGGGIYITQQYQVGEYAKLRLGKDGGSNVIKITATTATISKRMILTHGPG